MRAAVDRADSVGTIDRVVTLGTPFLGATKALGVLDYQQPCQADPPFGLPGCIINRAKAQQLATNWPGFLELLPSRDFHAADRGAIRRPNGFLSFGQYRNRLTDRNLALVDAAFASHDRLDRWAPRDPELELLRIVGDGLGTIRWVREFQVEECSGIWWWRTCELVDTFEFTMGSGDGTVPTDSADLVDVAAGFDDRGTGVNAYAPGVNHNDLTRTPAVIDQALAFLAGTSTTPATARAAVDDLTSLDATATPLTATELVVRSAAADGVVTDRRGRRLGAGRADGASGVPAIPGGTHDSGPDTDQYVLAEEGSWNGSWTATETGEMELVARSHVDGVVADVAATGPFAVPAGATVSLAFATPFADDTVVVVDDADGRRDRTVPFVTPGEALPGTSASGRAASASAVTGDVVAPTTRATVERTFDGEAWWAEVDVEAIDTGGAGVARVDWALDVGEVTGVVDGPLRVPAHGELHLRAVDAAGNVQAPHQVVVLDDAPSQPAFVEHAADGSIDTRGRLEFAGDVDVWAIDVAAPGRYVVQLAGLRVDLDLTVLDADGARLAVADHAGRRAERVVVDLPAGRSFVEMSGVDGAHHVAATYRLRASRRG